MRAIELERFDFRRAVVPRDVRGRHRAYVAALARFDRAGRRIIRDGGRLRGLGAAFAPVAQTSRRLVGALDYDD